MKKAYINLPDSKLAASEFLVTIEYADGEVFKETVVQYSYSNVFEVIKQDHEDEYDRRVKSIKIEFVK